MVKRRPQPKHSRRRRMASPSSAWRESTTRSSSTPHQGHRTPLTIVRESGCAPPARRRSSRPHEPGGQSACGVSAGSALAAIEASVSPALDDVLLARASAGPGPACSRPAGAVAEPSSISRIAATTGTTARTARRRRTRGDRCDSAPGDRAGRTAEGGGTPDSRVQMRPTWRLLFRTPVRYVDTESRTPVRCQPVKRTAVRAWPAPYALAVTFQSPLT